MVVLESGFAGLAVVEILTDGTLVPVSPDSSHIAAVAGDIVMDGELLSLLLHS